MESAPGVASATAFSPVLAQFTNHEFAERVIQVARVISAAKRLLHGGTIIRERLFLEQLVALFNGHPFGMQSDRRQIPDITKQGIQ